MKLVQLILALYSPRQKPNRWHWVPTVLRVLNAEITSERFVVFRGMELLENLTRPEVVNRCDYRFMTELLTGFMTKFMTGFMQNL